MKKLVALISAASVLCAVLVNTAQAYFPVETSLTGSKLVRVNYQAHQAIVNCGSVDKADPGPANYGPVECYKIDFSIPDGMFPSKQEITPAFLHSRYAHKFQYNYK